MPRKAHNGLLDKLPAGVCARLAPHLQLQELPVGKVLYEAGAAQNHMYFPRTGVISLLYSLESGDTTEVGMVGNEGVVGAALVVDSHSTPAHAVVQMGGQALCLKADVVIREFNRGEEFQILILRYTQVLLAQMAQNAVCNRYHNVEKQLCRWLLLYMDRMQSDHLAVTQETIAARLGVRREGVTEAAGRLQQAGVIQYARGRIRILDRQALELRSCECYRAVKQEYERLLSNMPWSTLAD
ncbi:Crp/Fnr family transcriptional regulator [Lysobacter helvus]|uniref:CRP-like protein Clp n=2 Tax=Lysobacteraceae TaxID=32033 RepID=A0ABM7Q879_9GAMM|nr:MULTISPECIES: Crp/Fnr family transcriptional regulator [Lysobacter]BCT93591.1 Crp/Fnr family transcriptional regulator [Lysobacter caseinilyticus]BCT96745.1 Crp/Fnr family transcriptional regulator [Lysobacter helvus]